MRNIFFGSIVFILLGILFIPNITQAEQTQATSLTFSQKDIEAVLNSGGLLSEKFNIDYNHSSDGLGDWAIPVSIRKSVVNSRSCAALSNKKVYLPLDFSKRNICRVFVNYDKQVVVYAVGQATTYESYSSLARIFFVLNVDGATLYDLKYLMPETTKKVISDYTAKHPTVEFPNKEFSALYNLVGQSLNKDIVAAQRGVKNEVYKKFAELEKIAKSDGSRSFAVTAKFSGQEISKNDIPEYTNVTLELKGDINKKIALGKAGLGCGGTSLPVVGWKPQSGALATYTCYYAGYGDEYVAIKQGRSLIVKYRQFIEVTPGMGNVSPYTKWKILKTIPLVATPKPAEMISYNAGEFTFSYPSTFTVSPSLRSSEDNNNIQSLFIKSPDSLVEFYVLFGRAVDPTDIKRLTSEAEISRSTEVVKDASGKSYRQIERYTIKDKSGKYTRSYEVNGYEEGYVTIFGIKYVNKAAYDKYLQQYLDFKKSVK